MFQHGLHQHGHQTTQTQGGAAVPPPAPVVVVVSPSKVVVESVGPFGVGSVGGPFGGASVVVVVVTVSSGAVHTSPHGHSSVFS